MIYCLHGNRYQCLSLFVALTIVMCSQCSDRSRMIHQWIQIAVELRGNLGNLFGFSAVMAGLKSPQVCTRNVLSNVCISLILVMSNGLSSFKSNVE